ncbi:NUDIX domain-containing protein [Candidatus Woesebacteria bacterium]|nr:NUDIX domain-containing protein [Candidatus Woesebacteria bacterium]
MKGSSCLHEVVITAIVVKGGKYLITRRSKNKKRFPEKWTVPGGKLETSDYIKLPKDTEFYWYNVLERVLAREVKEEVGIKIDNVEYVTSLATVHEDGNPSLVVSCMADYVSGKLRLQKEESDAFAWVSLKEAKGYDLIDGIYEELVIAENKKKGRRTKWQKHK